MEEKAGVKTDPKKPIQELSPPLNVLYLTEIFTLAYISLTCQQWQNYYKNCWDQQQQGHAAQRRQSWNFMMWLYLLLFQLTKAVMVLVVFCYSCPMETGNQWCIIL